MIKNTNNIFYKEENGQIKGTNRLKGEIDLIINFKGYNNLNNIIPMVLNEIQTLSNSSPDKLTAENVIKIKEAFNSLNIQNLNLQI